MANTEIRDTGGGIVLVKDKEGMVMEELAKQRKESVIIVPNLCQVHFTNLQDAVCQYIKNGPAAVMGCVAWFTNRAIIETLFNVPSRVAIQREDWMRYETRQNDQMSSVRYKRDQLERLGKMPVVPLNQVYQNDPLPVPKELASQYQDWSVRCVGHLNAPGGGDKKNRPLMHHKFLVFYLQHPVTGILEPYAVITGSANMTANMTSSIENMIYIEDRQVALRYHREFQFIYGLSVPVQMIDEGSNQPSSTFVFDCSIIPRTSPYFQT